MKGITSMRKSTKVILAPRAAGVLTAAGLAERYGLLVMDGTESGKTLIVQDHGITYRNRTGTGTGAGTGTGQDTSASGTGHAAGLLSGRPA
jgi:hypothetical protein